MKPDHIKAIRVARGWSRRQLGEVLGLGKWGERRVRYFEAGEREPTGAEVRLLEMLERGELPERYLPAPVRKGRPPRERVDDGSFAAVGLSTRACNALRLEFPSGKAADLLEAGREDFAALERRLVTTHGCGAATRREVMGFLARNGVTG